MISPSVLDHLSTNGRLALLVGLLIVVSLAFFAAMLYVTIRNLRSTYAQERRRLSRCRLTGREAVGRLLEHLRLPADQIDDGAQIDHYDAWRQRVKLRTESSVSTSVAALAIAAHEVGHAEQFATGYWAARATRCLLILLLLGGGVLFVYPFAVTIAGTGEVNLTHLVALLAIFPVLRLPIAVALERDANRRARRLLSETRLADATEEQGIADLLRAGFRMNLVFSVGLILLAGACIAAMSLVESGLGKPLPTDVQSATSSQFDPSGQPSSAGAINLNESTDQKRTGSERSRGDFPNIGRGEAPVPFCETPICETTEEKPYWPMMFAFSLVLVWWAFRSPSKKASARSAAAAHHESPALP